MGEELKLHLDPRLRDRLDALFILYRETFPHRPVRREELVRQVLEEGLQDLLAELLMTPERRAMGGPGRKYSKRWIAA